MDLKDVLVQMFWNSCTEKVLKEFIKVHIMEKKNYGFHNSLHQKFVFNSFERQKQTGTQISHMPVHFTNAPQQGRVLVQERELSPRA